MEFFNAAVDVMKTVVVALGGGLGVWGAVNLLEGYGGDNPSAKSSPSSPTCSANFPVRHLPSFNKTSSY